MNEKGDRHKDKQKAIQIYRKIKDRQTDIYNYIKTNIQINQKTDRQRDRQIFGHTDRLIYVYICKWRDKPDRYKERKTDICVHVEKTNRQIIYRQTDNETDKMIYVYVYGQTKRIDIKKERQIYICTC